MAGGGADGRNYADHDDAGSQRRRALSVRIEPQGPSFRPRSDDARELPTPTRRAVEWLVDRQAKLFTVGFAGHAHISAEDCAAALGMSEHELQRAIEDVAVVFREEPLPLTR